MIRTLLDWCSAIGALAVAVGWMLASRGHGWSAEGAAYSAAIGAWLALAFVLKPRSK